MVHVRDDKELVDEEEHERTALAQWAVDLARLGDDHLRLLGNGHLGGDLLRGLLGRLERLDECLVLGDVALGVRKHLEQAVLERFETDSEVILLRHEGRALLLEIGPLALDHLCKQLLLETTLSHSEVDDRALRLHLGDVVRVGQLALQVEPEEGAPKRHPRLGVGVAAHVHLLVAQLEDELAPFGNGRAREHVLHDGVKGLATLLEEHGDALLHRLGHHAEVASEALLARDEAVRRLAPADPVDALQLRVDDQGVARAAHDDGRVLEGEPIGRQTLGHPDRLRGHVGE